MQPAELQGRTSGNQTRMAVVLALATVAFGFSTVYLARNLNAERARRADSEMLVVTETAPDLSPPQHSDQETAAPASVAPPPPTDQRRTEVTAQPAAPADPGTTPPSGTSRPSPTQEIHARRTLEELSDPIRRAQEIAKRREVMERYLEQLVSEMGLQPHQAESVLDFMAGIDVNNQLRQAECLLRPDCDQKADERRLASMEFDQLTRSIGPEGMRRFLDYEARQRVKSFSRSLGPGLALTEDRVDRLTEALVSGRQRWIYTQDPIESLDEQLRDDAAKILSEEQLAAFIPRQRRHFNFN